MKGFAKWFNSAAWQPMKSLEFGVWQPMKSLDYKFSYAFICQVFSPLMRFIVFYDKPAFIDPVWLSTTRCQYMISYNPTLIDLVWF